MTAYNAEYHKQYRSDNKERIAVARRRAWLGRYKLTPETYAEMLEAQGGVCKICKQPEVQRNVNGDIKMLAVDHDHACCPTPMRSCGKCVRHLLCARCNKILGMVGDDISLLAKSIIYLKGNL
jgi:hypothetical protein